MPQFGQTFEVQSRVPLFVGHDPYQALPKLARRLGKRPQNEGHDLQRLQLVVGHDVMGDGAAARIGSVSGCGMGGDSRRPQNASSGGRAGRGTRSAGSGHSSVASPVSGTSFAAIDGESRIRSANWRSSMDAP